MNPWGYLERQAVKKPTWCFHRSYNKMGVVENKCQYLNISIEMYYYILIETYYVLVNIRKMYKNKWIVRKFGKMKDGRSFFLKKVGILCSQVDRRIYI